jgi:hypothetical protein
LDIELEVIKLKKRNQLPNGTWLIGNLYSLKKIEYLKKRLSRNKMGGFCMRNIHYKKTDCGLLMYDLNIQTKFISKAPNRLD